MRLMANWSGFIPSRHSIHALRTFSASFSRRKRMGPFNSYTIRMRLERFQLPVRYSTSDE